ncbi:MAG: hypothetical protein WC980_06425 [Candidatus Brocadiia bacterium]
MNKTTAKMPYEYRQEFILRNHKIKLLLEEHDSVKSKIDQLDKEKPIWPLTSAGESSLWLQYHNEASEIWAKLIEECGGEFPWSVFNKSNREDIPKLFDRLIEEQKRNYTDDREKIMGKLAPYVDETTYGRSALIGMGFGSKGETPRKVLESFRLKLVMFERALKTNDNPALRKDIDYFFKHYWSFTLKNNWVAINVDITQSSNIILAEIKDAIKGMKELRKIVLRFIKNNPKINRRLKKYGIINDVIKASRMHIKKYDNYLRVYDLRFQKKSFKEIGTIIYPSKPAVQSENLVKKEFARAYELIYRKKYVARSMPKMTRSDLIKECNHCPEQKNCKELCPQVAVYIDQDKVSQKHLIVGISPENQIKTGRMHDKIQRLRRRDKNKYDEE